MAAFAAMTGREQVYDLLLLPQNAHSLKSFLLLFFKKEALSYL
jgi:hypothetical protein